MKRILSLLALVAGGLVPQAEPLVFPVETATLKNGMKVLLHEDHSIPNVALYIFFKVGSRNERPGITGLSHFFEHMMFNGAKKYGPHMFDRAMENSGGSNNAYTSNDVTVYQDWFPSEMLELILDLEGDRIRDLNFDPKMVDSERGVVASERRTSVDNNNFGVLNEQFQAAAFIAHPYHWPVIGWMSDIQAWTLQDLKAHFSMGYAPNNAVMVVAGNVAASGFLKLAEKYIGSIPRRDPPPAVRTVEPEQMGERRIRVEKFAQTPIVMMGWHVPETANPDYYPLSILQVILLNGESSRLYRRLVDKDQLAISIDGGMSQSFDPMLFSITAQPREGIGPEKVEAALYEELDRVRKDLVDEKELQKAKNTLLAQFYRSMKTISGQANTLGSYEIFFGDYRKLLEAPDLFEKVSRDDLKRVAQKYFSEKNRTVATLIPAKEAK
ncbi:MAG: peptidase domain protein [Verrucomicrobiales bacterium]|nr:peptidase domain protein [Verrucomicrobiales bacterium]